MSRAARSAARVRAPYASKACDVCKRKKIRCDDNRPVCGPCANSRRHDECSWTGEVTRPPRTEAHFEALRRRIESLEAYCAQLESIADRCREEHGAAGANYRDIRPQDDFLESDANEDKDDSTEELIVSTETLTLEDRDLVNHGIVSPFRFEDSPIQPTRRISEIYGDPSAHYVLWLPSIPSSPSPDVVNLSFQWNKHLPEGALTRQEHDKVLDLLFQFFTSWCLRVIPPLFLRDMYRYIATPSLHARTPHYSPMLHNALVALATAFSDDPVINKYENRILYAQRAKAYLEEECDKPNICVVQALSLLGSFHASNGDHNLGYLYFGMSTRVAQILGLGLDSSHHVKAGRITHEDMLDRNWTFWASFSLDSCWSLYLGRDGSVPIPAHIDGIPVPFVDSEFDQMPFHHVNMSPQPSYLTKTFSATCQLLVVARRVMDVVNSFGNRSSGRGDVVNDEMISRMDLQLNSWKSNLPPELDLSSHSRVAATPHRLMMHLLYWLMFVLLHRPFFHRRPQQGRRMVIDHRKLCKNAAEHIMTILETWQKLYGLRYVPITLFQAVFSAGTVFLLLHRATRSRGTSRTRTASDGAGPSSTAGPLQYDSGSRTTSQYIVKVELCIGYLNETGRSWKCASKIANILSKLLEEQVGPSSSSRALSTTSPIMNFSNPSAETVTYSPPPGPPPGYIADFHHEQSSSPNVSTHLFDMEYQQIQLEDRLWGLYPQTNTLSPPNIAGDFLTASPSFTNADLDMLLNGSTNDFVMADNIHYGSG